MKTIKQTLFTGWHFMRWVRLVFGIFFLIQAIQVPDMLMGLAAGFFLVTAITNTGCCGGGTCANPVQRYKKEEREVLQYEELAEK